MNSERITKIILYLASSNYRFAFYSENEEIGVDRYFEEDFFEIKNYFIID